MSSSPRARPSSGTIVARVAGAIVLIALAALLVLNGPQVWQSFFPPEPATTQGRQINDLYTVVFVIAAAIFFIVEGLIIWTVIRYRRREGDDELPPQTHGHNLAELIWTVVPTIIVIFLFFASWQTLNAVEAVSPQPDLRVRAVAGQFQWTFDYLAEDGETVTFTQSTPSGDEGGLFLPAGQTTHLYLRSPDVIHAFYVPRFLFKRDVVPGMQNEFDLTIPAEFAGQTFGGQCAELCGVGHRIMVFDVHVLEPVTFQAWFDARLAQANATPTPVPSGGGGPVIEIAAQAVKFDKDHLDVPAGAPFTISFDNRDPSVPHDVDVVDVGGAKVFDGQDFPGPAKRDYGVPPIPAGDYTFRCSIHPDLMKGTLTAK